MREKGLHGGVPLVWKDKGMVSYMKGKFQCVCYIVIVATCKMCVGACTCVIMCILVWIHVCSSVHCCGCMVDSRMLWQLFEYYYFESEPLQNNVSGLAYNFPQTTRKCSYNLHTQSCDQAD